MKKPSCTTQPGFCFGNHLGHHPEESTTHTKKATRMMDKNQPNTELSFSYRQGIGDGQD